MRTNRKLNPVNRGPIGDLVRLANLNGGKIPATIPDHYVMHVAAYTAKGK